MEKYTRVPGLGGVAVESEVAGGGGVDCFCPG